jgi:CubicO group peptidase (beta-lactamase class C family)
MSQVTVEVDPGEVGFDAARLARIDEHFARYVEDGRLPGWQIVVTRHGRIVHASCHGRRDVEADLPVEPDTVFRIYSMTKPITSVAAMMLYEEGRFDLKDPLRRYIPAFRDTRVYRSGSFLAPVLEPQTEPIRLWHLLTHTAGLTYGFHYTHPVDQLYRNAGFEWGSPADLDLAGVCDRFAELPLVHQPGSSWNYSVATDVLGRVVEVVSGLPLDEFFRTRIFEPLGMTDTAFWADEARAERLAALYVPEPGTRRATPTPMGRAATREPLYLSGGGGLVSTAHDYHRFTQMLRGGGELDGVRLLSPRTLAYMASNHLPGGVDLEAFGQSTFAETSFDGVGFGLGFSVTDDPVANKTLGSVGEYGWGGAASTAFWVDPVEDLTALFFTQLLPSSTHPIRPQLKQLVYQALVG